MSACLNQIQTIPTCKVLLCKKKATKGSHFCNTHCTDANPARQVCGYTRTKTGCSEPPLSGSNLCFYHGSRQRLTKAMYNASEDAKFNLQRQRDRLNRAHRKSKPSKIKIYTCPTKKEAQEHAKHEQYRFKAINGKQYACAEASGCKVKRFIVQGEENFSVYQLGQHEHETAGKTRKMQGLSQKDKRKLSSAPANATASEVQTLYPELELTVRQIQNFYSFHDRQANTDWKGYKKSIDNLQKNLPDDVVMASDITEEHQVVVVALREMCKIPLQENDCLHVDGNGKFTKNTLCMFSVTANGARNAGHKNERLGLSVQSGKELQEETVIAMRLLGHLRMTEGQSLDHGLPWMTDGGDGFRLAIADWSSNNTIGMCYYHVVAALRQKWELLENGRQDLGQMSYEVSCLADCTPDKFDRAVSAVKTEWLRVVGIGFGSISITHGW